jgi:oligopeptide transport system ATP-binding protein
MSHDHDPVLEVEDLCVDFHTSGGVVHAVSHVSFKLARGEVLGIVGESGSGKTVTANAIIRLLPNTARITGGIKLLGRDVLSLSKKVLNHMRGKDIAMIFQDPMTSLNPLYTIGNQITETLRLHMGLHGAQARKRAVELLDMVRMPQPALRLTQYPHEFSGGMRQRAMIAMALACNPSILIADEPTTALDVTIQAQILSLMKDLQEQTHTSILLITHDLGIVADMCDRVNVMYGSQLMETGSLDDIFYRTAHPYTRALLQCLPEVAALAGKKELTPIGGAPVDLMMLPPGCAFAARCERCMQLCLNRRPDPAAIKTGVIPASSIDEPAGATHYSRCWLSALQMDGEAVNT